MNSSRSLSNNDRQLVELMLTNAPLEISQLEELLGVTATAVRQRLNRLMALGLVERANLSEGRGRPVHQYSLTDSGRRSCGNNLADLAVALWREVQQIDDVSIRQQVIEGAAKRLANKYKPEIAGTTVKDRMKSVAALFEERDLPVRFTHPDGELPIISMAGCLYPDLADDGAGFCEIEQQVLSEVIGEDVKLCQCQKHGDKCCSFEAVAK